VTSSPDHERADSIKTVQGGEAIRRARSRALLSPEELAGRLGIAVAEVEGWERGDPPFSLVDRAVRACGAELSTVLAEPEPDPHDLSLLETTLSMSVEERLRRLVNYVRFVQAGREALRRAL
jgi:transcriptional regulator with XRE-family HTH domain